jgi:hypothetical protein
MMAVFGTASVVFQGIFATVFANRRYSPNNRPSSLLLIQ